MFLPEYFQEPAHEYFFGADPQNIFGGGGTPLPAVEANCQFGTEEGVDWVLGTCFLYNVRGCSFHAHHILYCIKESRC